MTSDPSKQNAGVVAPLLAAKSTPAGSLLIFFALTYAVTWTIFIGVAKLSGSGWATVPTGIRQSLLLPGVFAPALVAIAMTARAEGSAGVRALLNRVVQWRVGLRWFVFAAGYMAAIKLTVALVHRIAAGAWPRFGDVPWYIIPVAIVTSTPFQSGEEIGWRGYALPRLAARFGFARASILLGLIWACWHLPLFFIPAADTYGQSFIVYVLQVTAISVAMAWLYAGTRGSLLLTMVMHAAINNSKDIVPSAVPGAMNPFGLSTSLVAWLTVALLWVCAAYFLVRMPRAESQRA
jgi:membrane protease YdiL (CAAX protease family)